MHLDEIERRHLLDTIPALDLWDEAIARNDTRLQVELLQRYGGVRLVIMETPSCWFYLVDFLGHSLCSMDVGWRYEADYEGVIAVVRMRIFHRDVVKASFIASVFDRVCNVTSDFRDLSARDSTVDKDMRVYRWEQRIPYKADEPDSGCFCMGCGRNLDLPMDTDNQGCTDCYRI